MSDERQLVKRIALDASRLADRYEAQSRTGIRTVLLRYRLLCIKHLRNISIIAAAAISMLVGVVIASQTLRQDLSGFLFIVLITGFVALFVTMHDSDY